MPCAFNIHLQYSFVKLRGVVLTLTLHFILYWTSFYFILISLYLFDSHIYLQTLYENMTQKENYKSTSEIVQRSLLR